MNYKKCQEQGYVLILSITFLLIFTVAVLTSLQSSSLQQLMVANYEHTEKIRQYAESDIQRIKNYVTKTNFTAEDFQTGCTGSLCFTDLCNNGLCKTTQYSQGDTGDLCINDNSTEVWKDSTKWQGSPKIEHSTNKNSKVITRYLIEFRCYVPKIASVSTPFDTNQWYPYFRISVLTQGDDEKSKVLLQSYFVKK